MATENGEFKKLLKALRGEIKRQAQVIETYQQGVPSSRLSSTSQARAPTGTPSPAREFATLFDLPVEGESVETHLQRLEEQNRVLSLRCTELLLESTEKDRAVHVLRQRVEEAAHGHREAAAHEAPLSAAKEFHLQQEIAHLREEVMRQQLSALQAQEELLRMRESTLRR